MPTPAYIDLSLYLPAGGVNGFELNGFAVNGVGFVDSPFAGGTFTLDPYRSIVEGEPQQTDIRAIYPSLLSAECDLSIQSAGPDPSILWAARCEADVDGERQSSSVTAEGVSMEIEVSYVSMVFAEFRTTYVLATHPSSNTSDRQSSEEPPVVPSLASDEVEVSEVPAESRTTKVPRGDS